MRPSNSNSANGINIRAEDPKATAQEGRERCAARHLEEATQIFHRLAQQFPERLDLYAQLGYLALLANDLDTAIAHLAQAINLGLRALNNAAGSPCRARSAMICCMTQFLRSISRRCAC